MQCVQHQYIAPHHRKGETAPSDRYPLGTRALEDFNQTIILDPTDVAAYNSRGIVYAALNQLEQAREDFNQAITLASIPKNVRLSRISRSSH